MNLPLNSCIYEGKVWHHRLSPFTHKFQYRIFQLFLDLEELDHLFRGRVLWSTKRPAIARFHRKDHLGDPSIPLDESVRNYVEETTGERPAGPVRLLTNLRYYGYVMNPVSFYFCYSADGLQVQCIVAEVHNTPWGEEHCYMLTPEVSETGTLTFTHSKDFHVSPFLPLDMEYRWRIKLPDESLEISIENYRSGEKVFDASLQMQRFKMTSWNLNSRLIRFPWMTGRIIAAIYWQALKLWWKGATYYPHPKVHKSQAA